MLITILNNVWLLMSSFFSGFFDIIFTPVLDILEQNSNPFTDFLLTLVTFTNLEIYLEPFTLGTLIFGMATIVVLIIYFFIP